MVQVRVRVILSLPRTSRTWTTNRGHQSSAAHHLESSQTHGNGRLFSRYPPHDKLMAHETLGQCSGYAHSPRHCPLTARQIENSMGQEAHAAQRALSDDLGCRRHVQRHREVVSPEPRHALIPHTRVQASSPLGAPMEPISYFASRREQAIASQ